MRTTLSVQDDVFELTRNLAEQRKMSLSEAFNYLVRRGLNSTIPTRERNGMEVFDTGTTGPGFGAEDVNRIEETEDAEHLSLFRS
jgi:hypothetical protein